MVRVDSHEWSGVCDTVVAIRVVDPIPTRANVDTHGHTVHNRTPRLCDVQAGHQSRSILKKSNNIKHL